MIHFFFLCYFFTFVCFFLLLFRVILEGNALHLVMLGGVLCVLINNVNIEELNAVFSKRYTLSNVTCSSYVKVEHLHDRSDSKG